MTEENKFMGFPKKTLTFFKRLSNNNSREWFLENKNYYEDNVKTPSMDFVLKNSE